MGHLEGLLGRILDFICRRYCCKRDYERSEYCGVDNWPPNHPGGVAVIKQKNKRLGCEPMRKH